MSRKKFSKKLISLIWKKTNGYCWHCNTKIYKNNWNIDHFPVRYNDIKTQILFGITNQHEPKNLVPSCVNCNVSHKYERKLYFYGNRSQCPCNIKCIFLTSIFMVLLFFYIFYLSKLISSKVFKYLWINLCNVS